MRNLRNARMWEFVTFLVYTEIHVGCLYAINSTYCFLLRMSDSVELEDRTGVGWRVLWALSKNRVAEWVTRPGGREEGSGPAQEASCRRDGHGEGGLLLYENIGITHIEVPTGTFQCSAPPKREPHWQVPTLLPLQGHLMVLFWR